MFDKIKCKHCEELYDETFRECPKCHTENDQLDRNFKNIQMVSIGKQIGLFLMGLGGFEVLGIVFSLILAATGMASRDAALANMVLNTTTYTTLFLCLLLILFKDTKLIAKSFKKWEPYVAGICCCFTIILLGIIYSYILEFVGVKISSNDNQQSIDSTSGNFPLTSMIIFGLIGPICEELTYRVGLFSFTKRVSKWLAYPVSVIIFALIHFNFTASSITNELWNLPYYLMAGFCLTITYDKFGFAGSSVAHILNNVISLLPFVLASGGIW